MRLTLTQRVGLFGSLQHAQIELFVNLADVKIDFSVKASALLSDDLSVHLTEPKYDSRGDEMIMGVREITSQSLAQRDQQYQSKSLAITDGFQGNLVR